MTHGATGRTPPTAFDALAVSFKSVKTAYDHGQNNLSAIGDLAEEALRLLLAPGTETAAQGKAILEGVQKNYELRRLGRNISRPIRCDLFIAHPGDFAKLWAAMRKAIDSKNQRLAYEHTDTLFYTAAMSFAASYDLYRPSSRKTPGTFFEVMIGALLSEVSGRGRGKQVTIPGSVYKVPTDIVLDGTPTLVIPTKITTRERVVQPFAHQRVLEDAAPGAYRSILVAVSELQRDGDKGINEICVPGQIGMYQKHLSKMHGMYYLDPPAAYMKPAFTVILPTKRLSVLLETDLATLLKP